MSPQLALSACASVLAMAALAVLGTAADGRSGLSAARLAVLQVQAAELPRAEQLLPSLR